MSDEWPRVWLTQVLCPARHCILANAVPASSQDDVIVAEQALLMIVEHLIEEGVINPWCGLCQAKRDTWKSESGRTPFKTMEDAKPFLKAAEADNIASGFELRRRMQSN